MSITWLPIFSSATTHQPFQIQQNSDALKFICRVNMNIYLGLIVNACHFITINSNLPCCTYIFFCCINDNLMCTFYSYPSNTITMMLLGVCLTFRNWSKIVWFQSWREANLVPEAIKIITNCKYFFFFSPIKYFVTNIYAIVSLS